MVRVLISVTIFIALVPLPTRMIIMLLLDYWFFIGSSWFVLLVDMSRNQASYDSITVDSL